MTLQLYLAWACEAACREADSLRAWLLAHRSAGSAATKLAALQAAYKSEGLAGVHRIRRASLSARLAEGEHVARVDLAGVSASLGDLDAAFEALDSALVEREPGCLFLRTRAEFRALRGDARFEQLLERIDGKPDR